MALSLLVLQLADSAFPAGGFAHSGGLEAAAQLGEITGPSSLERFLLHNLEQAGAGALPIVTAAHASPKRLSDLDRRHDAFLTNHVSNRASRAQGRAWLAAAAHSFGIASLRELRVRAREDESFCGHFAPVFGAVSALLGLERDEAQRLFLFLHLRGLVSSAVRLSLLGPLEAQALQHRLTGSVLAVLSRHAMRGEEDLTTTAPLVDLFQGHQDRLYSRLFSS
ncbi:urease accessory protein UreF [Polyangium jinanense]|uniref:Urease accessory protein UreF n=1 Tax=Polyangium jinanense TaxID=2829994 RepID=A0A9X3X0N9_9BACT|nr:urease accessory UreF family protein [Polyangium jinanense]MDC3952445.1 urease accessory protein UreF [Polyangium jinanense]MDC3980073.1 urease accessory protein UreF [Polyangium jinanense]